MTEYYSYKQGVTLRRMFPKQLNTPAHILIWTIIFALNIAIVILTQNALIYPIADFSKEEIEKHSYFEDYEIQNVNLIARNGQYSTDYYVQYINETGESRIVCIDGFPANLFQRGRIVKATDMQMLEDGTVQYSTGSKVENISKEEYFERANLDSLLDALLGNASIKIMAGVYIALGTVMLLIEFFFYGVFYRLFRE